MNFRIFKTGLSILMTMAILLLTVGCSIDELEFYSLSKKINQMNAIETSGTVSIELGSELVNEMKYSTPSEMQIMEELFASGFDIKYTARVSKNPLAYELKIDFRKKGEAEYKKITTIIGNDKVMYLNLRGCLIFLKPYILAAKPSEEKVINTLIAKVDYLQIDSDFEGDILDHTTDLSNTEGLIRMLSEFTDLFKEAYSNYSTGMVNKKGNGYELRLEAKDIKSLIIKFTEYTIANIDNIVEKISTKINSMPEKDIAYLADAFDDSSLDKEELLSGLEDFRSGIKQITPEEIDELKNDESVDRIFKSIEGSVLSNYMEKENDNTYKTATELNIEYEGKMLFNLKETSQITKLDAFSIDKPSQTTTIEGVQPIIASVLPPQVDTVKINLKTKKASITYSDKKTSDIEITYHIVEGDTYVSLTTINRVLGTQISWDEKNQTGLIKKDGETIELAANKIDGYIYVKVADLKRIGYSVFSDAATHEINIINLTKQSIFQ
ncbi:MAG TPA: stalk domain-containing protein [Clostridia bacterium]|nr:stalk domain-containing protein [Clostridia bacterium]